MKYILSLFTIIILGTFSSSIVHSQSQISYPVISNGFLKGGSGSFTVTTYSFLGNNFQSSILTVGDTVTFLYPENDTSLVSIDEITFVWRSSSANVEYVLEFASDSLFKNLEQSFAINANETEVTVFLDTISNLPERVFYRLGTLGPNGVNYTSSRVFNLYPSSDRPNISLSNSYSICEGDTLNLTPFISGGLEPFEFLWLTNSLQTISAGILLSSENDTFALIYPTQTDSFAVIVTDATQKSDTAYFKIIVEPMPTINIEFAKDSIYIDYISTSYRWYLNDTLTPFTTQFIQPTRVGNYSVLLKSDGSCLVLSDDVYFVPRPKNLKPVFGTSVTQTNINLLWDSVIGATSYRYTISKDQDFSTTLLDGITTQTSFAYAIQNNDQTPFYWNVRTITSIDSSFDSDSSMFVYTQAPIASLDVSDNNFGSVILTQSKIDTISLINTGNVDLNVSSFRFSSSSSQVSTNGFGLNWTSSLLIPVGDTVKITVSFVPNSLGSTSENLIFISNNLSLSSDTIAILQGIGIANQNEVPPALVSPLNNSTNVSDPVILRWKTVPNAVTYEVSLDTLLNLSTAQLFTTADTNQIVPSLIKGKQYYWGVKSQFTISESSLSPTWTFTTELPPQTNVVIVSSLDLGDFPIDPFASKLFTVTVRNLTSSIQILNSVSSSNTSEFTVLPQQFVAPIQIQAGGVYSLKVKFKPSSSSLFTTNLTPILSTTGNVASGTISSSGRALAGNESVSNIILATSSDSIAQGDTLSVFMKIKDRSNFDATTVPKFRIWLEYDKRMLYFLNQNGGIFFNGIELSGNSFTTEDVGPFNRQMSSPPIQFSNSSDSTLLMLRFVAMMDTIETSSLYFSAVGRDSSGFLWLNQANSPIATQFTNLENTTVTLQLCSVDGKRFIVSLQKQIALLNVSPNPSKSEFIDVEYTVNENTDAKFYLINSAGLIVSEEVKKYVLVSENQTIRFKTNTLPTGSYYIVVETKTSMDIKSFQTSK